jgi:hypothetical protein
MPYMDVVWRSFRISWKHKYLWLIALFSGEGGGGFGSGGSGGGGGGRGNGQGYTTADIAAIRDQVTSWIADHVGLIVLLAIIWLAVVVAFFILAAVCEGATVRAAAEHDAERPWSLGWAWRAGVNTMWAIVRFRLLIIALGLPLALLFIGFALGVVIAAFTQNGSAIIPLILSGLLLVLIAFPYAIYLSLLDRLGSRALVLEQIAARASIARAHRLLMKRFGRTLVVWLLSIAVSIVLGILTACLLGIFFVPLLIIGGVLVANNSSALLPLAVVGVLLLLPVSLVVGGFVAAQSSTYWTLAFRRLDVDPLPPPVAAITG